MCTVLLAGRIALIPLHISTDVNEGWNGFQALRAIAGDPLYPPPGALIGNNYPPLSFYIVGWLGQLTGDVILAGRLVALASMLVTAGLIAAIARRLSPPATNAPALAALLFFGLCATLLRRYVALDDPQWLAQAVMTAGLLTALPRTPDEPPSARALVGSVMFLLIGGLIKHNALAAPLAVALWLGLRHRRAFVLWSGAATAGVAIALAIMNHLYGAGFFGDILAPRHLSWTRMVSKSALPLLLLAPFAAAAWHDARTPDRRRDLILIYALVAVPLGIFQRSGVGVDVNAHLEAVVALSILTALALANRARTLLALIVTPLLVAGLIALPKLTAERAALAADRRDWRATEARIRAIPGPVACETMALCVWAGKPFVLDFFLYDQRARRHEANRLASALERHALAGVQLDGLPVESSGERPSRILDAVTARYRLVYTDAAGRRLFVPTVGATRE